ncbi:MAG TPA: hypothetical protein VL200_09895 [Lacunisphaera sp.]|nr:hypothetical protein [Lacunisphaera sp.]
MNIPALADLRLLELRSGSPLVAQLLPSGALFGFRHGPTLLNQVLPDPAEDGLLRLLLRVRGTGNAIEDSCVLAGAGLDFTHTHDAARWTAPQVAGLRCTTVLQLHPHLAAWRWRVRVTNAGSEPRLVDVLHAQDLGLADEAAVRNNEAYVSQYLDLQPCCDAALGWTIFARQNQPASGGRHPWLGVACATGAEAFCTDGWQFFGSDHRLTGVPAALRVPALPSARLQYECALAGLQSRAVVVAPGAIAEFVFTAHYLADHPSASSADDLVHLRALHAGAWTEPVFPADARAARSLFTTAAWLHGERPSAAELAAWFPGPHRHQETAANGNVFSFFCAADTHVVTRDKEAAVARPHGHILRNGDSTWIDDDQFGLTCYAAGIFGAQVYLGNSSFGRLLPVVRNALNVLRAGGQRVFVRSAAGTWGQLGVPSVFAMNPGEARWIYRLGASVIEARVWCSARLSASFLELRVTDGPACEFLVSHQLVLDAAEFDHPGTVRLHRAEGWAECLPSPSSLIGLHQGGTAFAIAVDAVDNLAELGGPELLYPSGCAPIGDHLVLRTGPVKRCAIIMLGTYAGSSALPAAVQAARLELAAGAAPSLPPALPLGLAGVPAVSRLAEIVPWFNHNASIHFSAPHGLEQYGGAAWGVRDVCQGAVEWQLAAGNFATVRRILAAVFAQQYAADPAVPDVAGCWPQWFMFPPYRFIQQAHSHGDVCLWPVKALCDYVEASNDFGFLSTALGYTDPQDFTPAGAPESLWRHCDRVVAHCEARFLPGTALMNYGDGDWDDTLQPADPTMRTRMVSAWTVGLAYHTFRQLAEVSRRAGETARAEHLAGLLARLRADFVRLAMPDGIVAGFLISESAGFRPLLHPADRVTGIRYRLLPMTRAILAELFDPAEARRHLEIIERELRFPDGVRLMSEPAVYHDGLEKLFKRADTAANVGREIGLQYVHAHIRYAEALAKVGDAERLWWALQAINPVALAETVPNAASRQANMYFSSSDADFADRHEAARRWPELRDGRVAVRGGWRLYSSGPGLFLHKVRSCLLGVRETFGNVLFDPVLPRSLDGLVAELTLCDRPVTLAFRVRTAGHSPAFLTVNGRRLDGTHAPNPYRRGGLQVPAAALCSFLTNAINRIEIEL